MKKQLLLLVSLAALAVPPLAQATDFVKANNTTALNLAGSWVANSGVPGIADRMLWNSTATGSATPVALGGNMGILGIAYSTPTAAQTISSGSTLSLDASGIDM